MFDKLTYLSLPQLQALYDIVRVSCKRCTPNMYNEKNYPRCSVHGVRCEVEPHVVETAKARDIRECPFS